MNSNGICGVLKYHILDIFYNQQITNTVIYNN